LSSAKKVVQKFSAFLTNLKRFLGLSFLKLERRVILHYLIPGTGQTKNKFHFVQARFRVLTNLQSAVKKCEGMAVNQCV